MEQSDIVTKVRDFLAEQGEKTVLRFSTVGSVDDGKSTLIGRLLHDTKSLLEDQVLALARDTKMDVEDAPLDFSLVTDGLRAEREQGITIDVAYRYFSTKKRNFIIADTPGHEQYTRNMATGASTANLAIILIDARHGVLAQTKRHSFIASLLGIPRLLIAINKMDLVDYSAEVFERVRDDYSDFAQRLGIVDLKFIPISALRGDNVVDLSEKMPWYHGESVLEYLETVYIGSDRNLVDFRFPVQYVMRPHREFRGFAGQVASGRIRKGEEVMVLPSLRKSTVKELITPQGSVEEAFPSQSVVIRLEDEVDVSRGDMLVRPNNVPRVETHFEAMLVWMSEAPLDPQRSYGLRHTTTDTRVAIQKIQYRVDVNTLSRDAAQQLEMNEIGRVALRANQQICFDPYRRNRLTGCFVLVDPVTNGTVAAGMIIDRVPAKQLREQDESLHARHIHRHEGELGREEREARLEQRSVTIWLTGYSASGKSSVAAALERHLFERGSVVFRLDGDNLRAGLNQDLGFSRFDRSENLRRVAEVSRLFNDAGVIVIACLISPYQEAREAARQIIGPDTFIEVHISTPLEVCEARDSKGLYAKARQGQISNFTGISDRYDIPESPALRLDTSAITVAECVEAIVEHLENRAPE